MNSPCLSESNIQTIQNLCEELKVKLHIREAFVPETEKSKCFFCSWNRRKSFFRACEELDCNILALGHHKDDIIETLLLNLFYHGEISTMPPKLDFFKGALTLVRPLSYIEEYQTKKYAKEHGFLTTSCDSIFNLSSKRLMIKTMIGELRKTNPAIKENLFNSMKKEIKNEYIL